MIQLGKYNTLKAEREMPQGMYLINETGDEVLLPHKYVMATGLKIGDSIEVFVYTDSEDRLVATTDKPFLTLGEFAALEVVEANDFGAYLNWGLEKDLFVPFRNQDRKMEVGYSYVVYLYEDEESDRLVATAKYNPFLLSAKDEVVEKEPVDVLVCHTSELGVNVIVNQRYKGLIFSNELFKPLKLGDRISGFVKKVREDGKLDIALEQAGYERIAPNAQALLDYIIAHKGRISLNDKSSPELIKQELQMSKKVFKSAVGMLYKSRMIEIKPNEIILTK